MQEIDVSESGMSARATAILAAFLPKCQALASITIGPENLAAVSASDPNGGDYYHNEDDEQEQAQRQIQEQEVVSALRLSSAAEMTLEATAVSIDVV